MDKILSAEEWANSKGITQWNDRKVQAYSTYLLEAFASDLINASIVSYVNETGVNHLLTKFKEKL